MTFNQRVSKLTSKEIIQYCIDAIENPVTEYDHSTLGEVRIVDNEEIPFGDMTCNAIAKIMNFGRLKLTRHLPYAYIKKPGSFHLFRSEIDRLKCRIFELALLNISIGCLRLYNEYAKEFCFAEIIIPDDHDDTAIIYDNSNSTDELNSFLRHLLKFQE